MPWNCQSCQTQVEFDDVPRCPKCDQPKSAWTMHPDQTRTLVLGARKLRLLRGASAEPVSGTSGYATASWEDTERVPALFAPAAAELRDMDRLPAPRDLLLIRPPTRKQDSVPLRLSLLFDRKEVRDVDLVARRGAPGVCEARALCVYGPGADEVSFPAEARIEVLDLGEETTRGYAPILEVGLAGQTPRELVVFASPPRYVSAQLFDEVGRAPLAELAYSLEDELGTRYEGKTCAEGKLLHPDVAPRVHWLSGKDARGQAFRIALPWTSDPEHAHLQHVRGFPGKDAGEGCGTTSNR